MIGYLLLMPAKATSFENGQPAFQLDRSRLEIGSLAQEPDDLAYWLKQPPDVRLAGIEFLRRQFYSYGEAGREFRRLLEITQPPRG